MTKTIVLTELSDLAHYRDEFGNEAEWAALLGRHMAAAGPDRLWFEITAA
ncbi:MAG: hypothetical protein J0H91_03445 [Rhodospirillales bacterium]|nr:hypothetical protein [Rhodospirillales bacterium]